MDEQVRVTTSDNPFDPFDDYKAWNNWDKAHNYHTTDLLARLVVTSDELSEEDIMEDTRRAMDEIVKYNASGVHILIKRQP